MLPTAFVKASCQWTLLELLCIQHVCLPIAMAVTVINIPVVMMLAILPAIIACSIVPSVASVIAVYSGYPDVIALLTLLRSLSSSPAPPPSPRSRQYDDDWTVCFFAASSFSMQYSRVQKVFRCSSQPRKHRLMCGGRLARELQQAAGAVVV